MTARQSGELKPMDVAATGRTVETDGPFTAHSGDGRTVEEWTTNDAASMLEQVALLGE